MRMDDDAIKALFDYIMMKGEVQGVLTYSSVHEWLKYGGVTYREINGETYWSKSCPDGSVIFHTDRGNKDTYIKVWTEKAGKLIGFEIDHNADGTLMMNVEDQKSSSNDIRDTQDKQMRKNEDDIFGANVMLETAVWKPSEYKCKCPHCGTTNYSNAPKKNYVCAECNKEFLATVAHTEE